MKDAFSGSSLRAAARSALRHGIAEHAALMVSTDRQAAELSSLKGGWPGPLIKALMVPASFINKISVTHVWQVLCALSGGPNLSILVTFQDSYLSNASLVNRHRSQGLLVAPHHLTHFGR